MIDNSNITATWGDRRTLTELEKALRERVRVCKETTESATIATAINVLRSLRAETSVMSARKPKVIEGRYNVVVSATDYKAGWAYPGKGNPRGRRVARSGNAATDFIDGKKIVNLAGAWTKGEKVDVYRLKIFNTASETQKAFCDCHCFAKSEDDVMLYSRRRIASRSGQYRGISKRAIGLAMHRISAGQGAKDATSAAVARLVERVVNVNTFGNGKDSGNFSLSVEDGLPRAALALKSGRAGVALAMKKAANATIGRINKMLESPLDKIPTPFPEVTGRKGKK